jgi:hypothetical protein
MSNAGTDKTKSSESTSNAINKNKDEDICDDWEQLDAQVIQIRNKNLIFLFSSELN